LIKKQKLIVGRNAQVFEMEAILAQNKSAFVALTGRRRIGKTYLVDALYSQHYCFAASGIQEGNKQTQIVNFISKIAEYSKIPIVQIPNTWQQVFMLLKTYLQSLPKNKKQVIFLDELPWMATAGSGFVQILAHLWNDYLSKEKHFILVICGSATSWINKHIVNNKGGLHNRLTHKLHLQAFTLGEVKAYFQHNNIILKHAEVMALYMALGGVPYYLSLVRKGESASTAIERLCFDPNGLLKYEYNNLYKAIFDSPNYHEAVVKVLAKAKQGLTRDAIIKQAKVPEGGAIVRTLTELLQTGFIQQEIPYGKKVKQSIYRVVDEYTIFYHKFIDKHKKYTKGMWQQLQASQTYKIWSGYAFEAICIKHLQQVKIALGINNIFTTVNSFYSDKMLQIDLLIVRNDGIINICECKYYNSTQIKIDELQKELVQRKQKFEQLTQSKNTVFISLITNMEVSLARQVPIVDNVITVDDLFY
jgi:uncharacterized protein